MKSLSLTTSKKELIKKESDGGRKRSQPPGMFVRTDVSGGQLFWLYCGSTVAGAIASENRFSDGTFDFLIAHVSSDEQQLRGTAHEPLPVSVVVVPAHLGAEFHHELLTDFVDPDTRDRGIVASVVHGDVLERDLGPWIAERVKDAFHGMVQRFEDHTAGGGVHLERFASQFLHLCVERLTGDGEPFFVFGQLCEQRWFCLFH